MSSARPFASFPNRRSHVALLTGGGDAHYAWGLAAALAADGIDLDFVGSNDLESPDLCRNPHVRFLNLRGDMSADAGLWRKVHRVTKYYVRLIRYAASSDPEVFHILWHNKLQSVDRTLLLAYYRLCGKRLVFTAHNVDAAERDGNNSAWNWLTLRIQYRLVDHVLVHTQAMSRDLQSKFRVPGEKISVIPYGINDKVPETAMTCAQARDRLRLAKDQKVVLFFGNIAPYKGLEFLVEAMAQVEATLPDSVLIIAGRPKGTERYWSTIRKRIDGLGMSKRVIDRIAYVPDVDIECYFKAADVFVLPYTHIFQSGVLFLGYNFGLPAIASDIACLRDDVIEGETGYVCQPRCTADLARTIERYFASDLYRSLAQRRARIRRFVAERHSWSTVSEITRNVYRDLLGSTGMDARSLWNGEPGTRK